MPYQKTLDKTSIALPYKKIDWRERRGRDVYTETRRKSERVSQVKQIQGITDKRDHVAWQGYVAVLFLHALG